MCIYLCKVQFDIYLCCDPTQTHGFGVDAFRHASREHLHSGPGRRVTSSECWMERRRLNMSPGRAHTSANSVPGNTTFCATKDALVAFAMRRCQMQLEHTHTALKPSTALAISEQQNWRNHEHVHATRTHTHIHTHYTFHKAHTCEILDQI